PPLRSERHAARGADGQAHRPRRAQRRTLLAATGTAQEAGDDSRGDRGARGSRRSRRSRGQPPDPGVDRSYRGHPPGLRALSDLRAVDAQAYAAPESCAAPPMIMAKRRPSGPPLNAAYTAPSAATPTVAPTIRATLMMAEAVPERAAGTAPTASPINGPVASPMPIPVRARPSSAKISEG